MNQNNKMVLEKFIEQLTKGFTPELAKHFAELPKPDQQYQTCLASNLCEYCRVNQRYYPDCTFKENQKMVHLFPYANARKGQS